MKRTIKYRQHTEYLTCTAHPTAEGNVYVLKFVRGRNASDAQDRARMTAGIGGRGIADGGIAVTVTGPLKARITVGSRLLAQMGSRGGLTATEALEYGSLLCAAHEQKRLVETGAAL